MDAEPGRLQTLTMRGLGPICRTFWNVEVEGLDHVPADGARHHRPEPHLVL